MAYIGNTPAENYASFLTETFTVSATANYTLSHAVTNENDIRLVINGVVQQPGSGKAYTASGTTLTLTSATVSGDVMYAVYLGRALQTVNPPAASVGNSQTAPTIITGQTAETSIATDDTILIHDTSASALRKMTRANFVSGIGGTNTPAFSARLSGSFGLSDVTTTDVVFQTELFDVGSCYNNSTGVFTVPSGEGGKYCFSTNCYFNDGNGNVSDMLLYMHSTIGGSAAQELIARAEATSNGTLFTQFNLAYTTILTLSAGDAIKIQAYADTNNSSSISLFHGERKTVFSAFKIIE